MNSNEFVLIMFHSNEFPWHSLAEHSRELRPVYRTSGDLKCPSRMLSSSTSEFAPLPNSTGIVAFIFNLARNRRDIYTPRAASCCRPGRPLSSSEALLSFLSSSGFTPTERLESRKPSQELRPVYRMFDDLRCLANKLLGAPSCISHAWSVGGPGDS